MHTGQYVRISGFATAADLAPVTPYLPGGTHIIAASLELVWRLAVVVGRYPSRSGDVGPRTLAIALVGNDVRPRASRLGQHAPLILVPDDVLVSVTPELGELTQQFITRKLGAERESVTLKEGHLARIRSRLDLNTAFGLIGVGGGRPSIQGGWNHQMDGLCGEAVWITRLTPVRDVPTCYDVHCVSAALGDNELIKRIFTWSWSSDMISPIPAIVAPSGVDEQLHAILHDRFLERTTSIRFAATV